MPKIVRFYEFGEADVLKLEDLPRVEPGEGEVRLKVEAIGLNRAEVGFREGRYLELPERFPATLGYEAAGVIDAIGAGVTGWQIGDRVSTIPAFSMLKYGMYGESAIAPVHAVGRYPENLSAVEGTAIWMSYITAYGPLVEYGYFRSHCRSASLHGIEPAKWQDYCNSSLKTMTIIYRKTSAFICVYLSFICVINLKFGFLPEV
jgi:NADPH:quinone reductase